MIGKDESLSILDVIIESSSKQEYFEKIAARFKEMHVACKYRSLYGESFFYP
jgi:hypothetical protein